MRMIQACDRVSFPLEPLAQIDSVRQMFRQNLDRDDAVETRITSTVDLAHAARTQRCNDFVRPEFGAGGQSHQCAPL